MLTFGETLNHRYSKLRPRQGRKEHAARLIDDILCRLVGRAKLTEEEKLALLDEFESLSRGEKDVWLRRKGLYSAQLLDWRKTLARKGRQGLELAKPGRKPKDPSVSRLETLQRESDRLRKRLDVADGLVSLQKKAACPPRDRRERALRQDEGSRRAVSMYSAEPSL